MGHFCGVPEVLRFQATVGPWPSGTTIKVYTLFGRELDSFVLRDNNVSRIRAKKVTIVCKMTKVLA